MTRSNEWARCASARSTQLLRVGVASALQCAAFLIASADAAQGGWTSHHQPAR